MKAPYLACLTNAKSSSSVCRAQLLCGGAHPLKLLRLRAIIMRKSEMTLSVRHRIV